MYTLYKKELGYYLNNPIGYIVIVLFAVLANFFFVKDIFAVGSASLRPFFSILPWLMMVFVPALTMRSLSEEKRTNTIETLLSLPISETQIVLAKFFSIITLVAIGLLLTVGLPVSLYLLTRLTYTRLYLPEVFVSYFGALLVAMSAVSLSLFFSSQTKNQVIAFLLSVLTLFLLIVFSTDFVASVFPKAIQDILSYLSPLYHLESFMKGILDLRSLFYFLSFTILFLFLTVVDLEKRS